MSTPISAINTLGGALLDAGDCHQQVTLTGERGDPLLDPQRSIRPCDDGRDLHGQDEAFWDVLAAMARDQITDGDH
jgi:hypothetical protein